MLKLTTLLSAFLVLTGCNQSGKIVSSLEIDETKNNYFVNKKGDLYNESTYKEIRNSRLAQYQEKIPSMKLYEVLEEKESRNDLTIYAYEWHFTDIIFLTKWQIKKDKKRDKKIIGKEYPIYQQRTLENSIIDIHNLKGKPTLINLWFTTCAPCIKEMPILNDLKTQYGDHYNFIAITMDDETTVRKFLEQKEFNFDHIVNSEELTTKMDFNGFPVNVFLNKQGEIDAIKGNVIDSKDFLEILERLEKE